MITAELLVTLQTLSAQRLSELVNAERKKQVRFESAKFIGITNGGEFQYNVTYTLADELHRSTVYLTPHTSLTHYSITFQGE